MKDKGITLIIIISLLALMLVGCEMSKSTPPAKDKEKQSETGVEPLTPEVLDPAKSLQTYATQTVMAATLQNSEITPVMDGEILTPLPDEEGGTSPDITLEPSVEQTVQAALGESGEPLPLSSEQAPLIGTTEASVVALAIIPTPTMGPPPQTYTVQKGEFLYCLARRFNVSISGLLGINGLGMNSQISPAQTLKIPQDGVPFAGDRSLLAHPTSYTVKAGDTIYGIACAFGNVDPLYMATANKLQPPYDVKPGFVLQVP